MESKANEKQVGGRHYQTSEDIPQHWDLVAMYKWDYFTAQIVKYLMRWKDKGGLEDLEKASHFLDKYKELVKAGIYTKKGVIMAGAEPTRAYVDQG